MIITVDSEIFLSPARVLVNPVNTAGVMSSGISAEFKRFFPEAFAQYRALCETARLEPGRLWLYKGAQRWVLHLPVKRHWRTAARADEIESGLQKLADTWADLGIHALAVPRLAADDLPWEDVVRPLIDTYLAPLPIPVYIHHENQPDSRRSVRMIDNLLNKPNALVPFDRTWRDLGRVIRRVYGSFTTDDEREFTAAQETGGRLRRLTFTPQGDSAVSVSESALADLWTMLNAAKLLLPSQFPGGLETFAPYLLPVLTKLDYVRVVNAGFGDGPQSPALLLVPPPTDAQPTPVTLTEEHV